MGLAKEMICQTGMGADIIVARNGKEALSHFDNGNRRPDLILVDLKLPRMEGLEALRLIRTKEGTNARVIVLTGSILDEDRRRAEELGVDAYFIKPRSMSELERTVFALKEIMLSLQSDHSTER